MSFSDYTIKFKEFLINWSKFALGEKSVSNFDYKVNTAKELNALRNAGTADQLIQLGNAYYDQVAVGRALSELYKTPESYFSDFSKYAESIINKNDLINNEINENHEKVKKTLNKSKSLKNMSDNLQLKLSRIRSDFDA